MAAGIGVLAPGSVLAVRGATPTGDPLWSFAARVLADDGDELVLGVRAGEPVGGPEPWTWPADGRHHFWRGRAYSVLATTRAGRFPYWYATVHTPPAFAGDGLRVVDLGLSVQLFADGRYSVGGEDEFAALAPTLPAATRVAARAALDEIVALIRARRRPFGSEKYEG